LQYHRDHGTCLLGLLVVVLVQDVRQLDRVELQELLHLVQEFELHVRAEVVRVLLEAVEVHPRADLPFLQPVEVQVDPLLSQPMGVQVDQGADL
jgi:hypothetical protein